MGKNFRRHLFIHWKVQQIKFQLHVREKNIPREGGEAWGQVAQRDCDVIVLGNF